MNKKIEIQIPDGKVAKWIEIDGKTILVAVDEVDNRPVTERIKTFEDAVKATGMTLPFDNNHLSYLPKDAAIRDIEVFMPCKATIEAKEV